MNVKRAILSAGAIAGALAATWAAVADVGPPVRGLANSGPLPFAGRIEVEEKVASLAAEVEAIQKASREAARDDARRDKDAALTRQQLLESLLAGARADFAKYPTNSGRAYVCSLISQVDVLRARNGFPPIPPC